MKRSKSAIQAVSGYEPPARDELDRVSSDIERRYQVVKNIPQGTYKRRQANPAVWLVLALAVIVCLITQIPYVMGW